MLRKLFRPRRNAGSTTATATATTATVSSSSSSWLSPHSYNCNNGDNENVSAVTSPSFSRCSSSIREDESSVASSVSEWCNSGTVVGDDKGPGLSQAQKIALKDSWAIISAGLAKSLCFISSNDSGTGEELIGGGEVSVAEAFYKMFEEYPSSQQFFHKVSTADKMTLIEMELAIRTLFNRYEPIAHWCSRFKRRICGTVAAGCSDATGTEQVHCMRCLYNFEVVV